MMLLCWTPGEFWRRRVATTQLHQQIINSRVMVGLLGLRSQQEHRIGCHFACVCVCVSRVHDVPQHMMLAMCVSCVRAHVSVYVFVCGIFMWKVHDSVVCFRDDSDEDDDDVGDVRGQNRWWQSYQRNSIRPFTSLRPFRLPQCIHTMCMHIRRTSVFACAYAMFA